MLPLKALTATVIAFFLFVPLGCGTGVNKDCAGPVMAEGHQYSVIAKDLPSVDNLAMTTDGSLYATLELKAPRGMVVRIGPRGKAAPIIKGLARPDGLRASGQRLFIVEETKKGRLLEYNTRDNSLRTLVVLKALEGIAVLPSGGVIVTEDRKKGKLIKVRPDGKKKVLKRGLARPEGIVMGKEGKLLYIAETKTGKVLVYRHGRVTTVLQGINHPDQLAFDKSGALLISEDEDPGRLLIYKDGKLSTLASCLSSPQGILPMADGILLSEQGRNRILKITRQ